MNEYLSKLLSLEKDIEKISKKQTIMKSVGILFVFAVFFCSFNPELAMKIAFVVSIIAIIVLFVLDSNLANKKHSLEVDIYLLELDQLKKDKDKKPDETGGMSMPGDWMDSISRPEEKATLPIIYYLVLIVLDVVLLIL